MEQQNDTLRERLLSRLPQPENLAGFREETAALLAKHEKAHFWEKMPSSVCLVSAFAIVLAEMFWGRKLDVTTTQFLWFWAGLLFFVGAVSDLRYRICRSKVDLLKEVKQVQLQMLELQASLQKDRSPQS
ncbi:MAG: hypothetical protein WB561_07630 [Terracidiphilus sp.]